MVTHSLSGMKVSVLLSIPCTMCELEWRGSPSDLCETQLLNLAIHDISSMVFAFAAMARTGNEQRIVRAMRSCSPLCSMVLSHKALR